MAMGGLNPPSSKDSSLNALFAQADAQAFIKQQQKLLQQLPANSPQRKSYEAILAEMKQVADLNRLVNFELFFFVLFNNVMMKCFFTAPNIVHMKQKSING